MIVLSTVIGLVPLQMKGEDSKTVIVSDGSEGTVSMRSQTTATRLSPPWMDSGVVVTGATKEQLCLGKQVAYGGGRLVGAWRDK